MKRREVIKGLGMSLGFVVATPTVVSLLQSCKSGPKIDWTPEFFSQDESVLIKRLVNLILPKTKALPGADEVNVPQFIDKYASMVASKEDQENFTNGLKSILKALGKNANKASNEDYDNLLAKYLKASPEEMEAFQKDENEKQALEALMGLRGISIWGYRNSQKVGMEVLVYDPIPGYHKGCVSLEETTGGRAWSL